MARNRLPIDHSATFPYLDEAPIVEAVLHWQAPVSKEYLPDDLKKRLVDAFPGYKLQDQHDFAADFSAGDSAVEFKQRSAWQGVRLKRQEEGRDKFVCQFLRQGVVFSQLAPYGGWEEFSTEAKKFWEEHLKLGKPVEVARLSVRFISEVPVRSMDDVEWYVDASPRPIPGVELAADRFFYQDTFELSDNPYTINTVRAVQPGRQTERTLIVDIDVLTSGGFEPQEVDEKLLDLRFIKNKVFFSILKNAEQSFGAAE